jgi:CRISPR-associated endonuclease Cas1
VIDRVADIELLAHAWEVVRRNDEADGVRAAGVERFGDDLTANLERLAAQVLSGDYRPAPLFGVAIPKPSGGVHRLQIPAVADRVLERALAEVVSGLVDAWFAPWSFAYRPSASVADAVRRLAGERDDGATHVVHSDLKDCFDTLDRSRVLAALAERVPDPPLLDLVEREGFAFLGEDFAGPYPTVEEPHQQPDQRTLYVGRQGASVHVAKGKVIVSDHDDEELLAAPLTHVGRVVLFGAVGFSAAIRSHTLYHHVPVVLLSRRGNYLGRLDSGAPHGVAVRRRQYAASADPHLRLALALPIVLGKIANRRALLLRYAAKAAEPQDIAQAAADLDRYAGLAAAAEDVGDLLGMEGAAAHRYFEAFAGLFPAGYDFPGRRRRPPTDVVNSMLSLGYARLTGEAAGALAAAGLDPAVGMLHADADVDRPSLALDLVEEFRALVVDTVVLACTSPGIVAPDATKPAPGGDGVYLTDAARTAFLARLEERLLTLFGYTPGRARVSYRRAIHLQARQLARILRAHTDTDTATYQPIRWR